MNFLTAKLSKISSNPLYKRVLPSKLSVIVLVAIVLRIGYILFFVELQSDYYWEYGEIAKNIHAGKGYSLFHLDGDRIEHRFNPSASPYPSAYMPPGYVIYLLPFLFVNDILLRNILILCVQNVISLLAVVAMFHLAKKHFSTSTAIVAASITAFLPEFIYASNSYTPTVLYQFGALVLLYVLCDFKDCKHLERCIVVGGLFAFLIYLRSEFLLFAFLVLLLMVLRGNVKTSVVVASLILILLLPWQIRNYRTFQDFIPMTTNAGINLLRGNSLPGSTGRLSEEIARLDDNNRYEVEMNRIYIKHAAKTIKERPGAILGNAFEKLFQLWVLNPNDERSGHVLYFLPWFLMLGLFLVGVFADSSWRSHQYLFLFLIHSSAIAFIFFALPRYQTMMKIAVIPFAAYGIEVIATSLSGLRLRR